MSAEHRAECLSLVREAVKLGCRKRKACEILNVSLRTVERWETNPVDGRQGPNTRPSNALTSEEREQVVKIANSMEFANLSPCQIVPLLADQGKYIASESSFYRILKERELLKHRSKSSPRTHKRPDELVAYGPNEIWSWDITYLKAAIKGTYYYLYLPMDIFSRKIVHFEIHQSENSELASGMIQRACIKNNVQKGQIVLHSDNGGPMKGATMLATLQRLGISPSFSRPKVSDDNPFSESLFKTLKYCPSFPERGFASIEDAREWVETFVDWYNNNHLHSGINFVTPSSRHDGTDQVLLEKRRAVYERAMARTPGRWTKGVRDWRRENIVSLNPGREMKKKAVA